MGEIITRFSAHSLRDRGYKRTVIVYKFGGALARTRRGIEALARITHQAHRSELTRARRSKGSEQHGLIVVVSAIGHTTRNLGRAAELAEDGKLIEAEALVDKVSTQHQQLASSLGLDSNKLENAFEQIGNNVRALLEGVAITRELSARTRDAVLAYGESFALALLESVLKDRELPVHAVDARNVIITNETFGHATPDLTAIAERAHRLMLPRLKRGDIVLLQGFVGATPDGITTTMGSESSDLTATLLAGALNAREVVIWKMLPGIYSADPELAPKAKLVRALSFEEAEEIGRRGARVLYPTFAHPLVGGGSKAILRVATPFATGARHTVLSRTIENHGRRQRPLTITLQDKLLALSILRRSTTKLSKNRNSSEDIANISLTSWQSQSEIVHVISKEMRRAFLRAVDREQYAVKDGDTLAALSIVFRKLKTDPLDSTFISNVTRSLRSFDVRAILPIEQSLIIFVNDSEGVAALKKLHHDLFES